MKIVKPDQYMDLYKLQKIQDPSSFIAMRAFRQQDVDDVDKIVELSRGNRETVKTDNDWNVLANLIVFFIQRWSSEWMEFRATMPDIRQTRGQRGYSRSKEIKYVGAIPPRLMKLIKVIFPNQQWDKRFLNKFVKKFNAFQVGGVQN